MKDDQFASRSESNQNARNVFKRRNKMNRKAVNRKVRPTSESLEQRLMMASNLLKPGFEGNFLSPSHYDGLTINITDSVSSNGKTGKNGLIGIVVQDNDTGKTVDPGSVRIIPNSINNARLVLQRPDLKRRSASLAIAQVGTGPFSLMVSPERGTTGSYSISTYLVGDTDGSGTVDQTDLRAINKLQHSRKIDVSQFPGADADLDGRITGQDMRLARKNLGASIQATISDPQAFQVPSLTSDQVSVQFKILGREAGYRNEFGIFLVDDAQGRIGNLKPGDAGYQKAAMSADRRIQLFTSNQSPNSIASVVLNPGQYFGTYIVANGSIQSQGLNARRHPQSQTQNVYLSFAASNADRYPHVLQISENVITLGIEDLWHGGDRDYNDITLEIDFLDPVDGSAIKAVSLDLDPAFDSEPKGDSVTSIGIVDLIGNIELESNNHPRDGFIVTLFDPAGTQIGTTTTLADGTYRFTSVSLTLGEHEYSVSVQDKNGNKKSAKRKLDYCGFGSDLSKQGWTTTETGGTDASKGSVAVAGGHVVLREGDSFRVGLERTFVIPENPGTIGFEFAALSFDSTAPGFINDAFEVALLGDNNQPLVPTFTVGRDAFFNVSEGLAVATGTGVTVNGMHVMLDISGQIPGTQARLVFRLVNNDADTQSSVEIVCAKLPEAIGSITGSSVNPAKQPVLWMDVLPARSAAAGANGATSGSGTDATTTPKSSSGSVGDVGPLALGTPADTMLDDLGRAVFTTSDDFLNGTLFNLVTNDISNDLRIDLSAKRPSGNWTEIIDSNRLGTNWGGIEFTFESVPGTILETRVRASDQRENLASTSWVEVQNQVLLSQVNGQYLEMEVRLKSISENSRADIIFVVDESGSMAGEQAWIGSMIGSLDEKLTMLGYSDNRFGLVGFADTPRSLPNSDSRFMNLTEFVTAAARLSTVRSGNEDGYAGLDYAIRNYEFRTDATKIVVLVTDEHRTSTNSAITDTTLGDLIIDSDVILHSILNSVLKDQNDTRSFGVDSAGVAFVAAATEGYVESPGGAYVKSESVWGGTVANIKTHYVDWTWGIGGTVWDLNVLRDGGESAELFTQSFVDRMPLEVGNTPILQEIHVQSVPLPTVEVELPAEVAAGTSLVLSGLATAAQPVLTSGVVVRNAITHVTVNGKPVDLLDNAGQFFMKIDILPGVNRLEVTAYDIYGQAGVTVVSVEGTQRDPGEADFSILSDISASFSVEYARTSFFDNERTLFTDLAVKNVGQYSVDAPLYVAISNLSDPMVLPRGADGYTPDGLPYYDVSGLVPDGRLNPDNLTESLAFAFLNLDKVRFTYDLVFFGLINRAPAITTVPVVEGYPGRPYGYDVNATDPDGDTVTFRLLTAPAGMTIEPATGLIAWNPVETDLGQHPVIVQANDGRGGRTEQHFTVDLSVAPPNRPPVFTSLPVNISYIGREYLYDTNAVDPDQDTLTFSLLANPADMTIDAATGLISWTPQTDQVGEVSVTVRADDSRGGTATQTYTLCVVPDPTNHAPVIVSQPVTTYTLPVVRGDGFPDYVIDYFAAGSSGIAEPYGRNNTHPTTGWFWGGPFQVDPAIILGPPPPEPRGGWVASTEWLSIPKDSHVTVGFNDEVIIDGPGNDIFIRSLDPADSAGESADIYVSTNLVDYVFLGRTPEGGNVGLDLATLNLDSPVKSVRVVGVDNKGNSPGFDLVSIEVFPNSIGDPTGYQYDVEAVDADNDPLTYSLISGPAGMTLDSSTGQVEWSPTLADVDKSFPVKIHVADGRGGMDEQNFEVKVKTQVICDTTPGQFDPVLEWNKSAFSVRPESNQVMMTPAVIDLNSDGYSDVIFSTFTGTNYHTNGVLRAISGRDGSEIWSVDDSQFEVNAKANIAVGDLDRDGKPEVIAVSESNQLIAFDSDGKYKWRSNETWSGNIVGGLALADIDGDGKPEIIFGASVVNSDGTLRWKGNQGSGTNEYGPLSIVADLDMDGKSEIIAGRTAYRADGSVYWNAPIPDGYTAIGNFDDDTFPEIAVVANGQVYLLNHDGTIKWGPVALPGGGTGGAPTVADVDGDGKPEIGVAGSSRYVVFETDGSIKWQTVVQDFSSQITGSSVFDFEGDGKSEVVYADELALRIYDGITGEVLYTFARGSGTLCELPVIVDVDSDGAAEIVVVANSVAFNIENKTGIYVIGDKNNTWVSTRKIWNQHSYHITNINDDGTIPANEEPSWLKYNSYRLNVQPECIEDETEPTPPEISDNIVIKSTAPANIFTGSLYRYDITAIGPENAVFNYSLTAAPAGMSVHPSLGVVVWTPTEEQIGSHQVVLRVRDQLGGIAQQVFTVNVEAVNTAPVITTAPKPTATVGLPYQYQVQAQDAESHAVTFAIAGTSPANLQIDPATGLVQFTPDASQVGSQQFKVVATDSQGAMTEQVVSLNVVATSTNQAPVISGNHRKVDWLGRDYLSVMAADDPDGDPLTYEIVNGPDGMTVDSQGVIRWTPAGNVGDLVDVALKVSDGRGGNDFDDFVIELLSQERNNRPVVTSVPTMAGTIMKPYHYTPAAFDSENDTVQWLLDKAPRGMSINPATGELAWTPGTDQLGPQQVTLRVRDAYFAESTQSFTVMVGCNNQAPQILSRPVTETWEASNYIYFVRSDDPENDTLEFSLLSAPDGMSIDSDSGLIRWSVPSGSADTTSRVVVAVNDGQGNQATQSYDLKVGQNLAALKNKPPVIRSRPRLAGTAGQSYSYQVIGRDPEGESLQYTLTSGPNGMSVDGSTGLLSWSPATDAIGTHVVSVTVSDPLGGKATQSYILTITANKAPVIASSPVTDVMAAGVYAYDLKASDPNGDDLSFSLENQPDGMTIDTYGRILWQTGLAHVGQVISGVRVIVSDPAGLSDSQTFDITVENDTEAPRVTLLSASSAVDLGSQIQLKVTATDNQKVQNLKLVAKWGDQQLDVPLSADGYGSFDAALAGMVKFVATATDIVGNQATQEVSVRVVDPSDLVGPDTSIGTATQILPGGQTRTFDPNTETVTIDYLLDITGTIDDPNDQLDSWKVIVSPFDKVDPENIDSENPIWRTIGSGTTEVTDAKLATLDPTVMANGIYTVAIVSTDTNGRQTIKTFDVNVEGQAKLGQFRQEFTDLSIPLNGVPITITRTYDTHDIGREGDFGYGWSLGVMSPNIQELVPPAPTDFFFNVAAPFTTKTRVFITAPDGRRLSFKFKPRFAGGFMFFSYHVPEFVAEAGNTDYRLEVDTAGINPNAKGEWHTMLLPFAYNPDNYRLIAKDGTTYYYNQTAGLQRIKDPNGNTVDFGPNDIVHSGGERITMDRDYRGRITKINAPDGTTIQYTYNANGDLIKVTDQAGLETKISYDPKVDHYVDKIVDPNGKTAARMEYDANGRLTSVIDANGNRVTQSFDPGNFTQTITDGNGKPTTVSYDERGNLLRSETPTSSGAVVKIYEYKDPANPDKETRIVENGIERTFTYDATGNKLSETTPAGTTTWTYTTLGKIATETDPLGRMTSKSYDARGNVTQVVNPQGDTSTYTYDTLGRVSTFQDFNGVTTTFTDYCDCGRPKTIVNEDDTSRSVATNHFAQVTKVVDEKGNLTQNIYDNAGRLTKVIDADGRSLNYEYAGANLTKVTDGLNNVTNYTYYDNNKRKSITDAEGGVTEFTYDKNGNQKTIKDPAGNITTFEYDEANRLIKEIDPLGKVKTFKYDTRGNRIESIDRLGRKRTFEYDAMNRLATEIWWDNGVAVYSITMTYDAVGNRLTANSPDALLTYTYDTANRIKTARTEYPGMALAPITLTYTYDAMGNVTEIRDNLGVSVVSTYDFRNNLTSRSMSGTGVGDGAAVAMEYDINGERQNILRFDDAARTRTAGRTDFTFSKNGLIQSIDHTSATGSLISAYGYQYDALNRLMQETHHGDTYVYGYDKTSQLISVRKNGSLVESFDFDANGNREKATGLTPGNYVNEKGNRYSADGTFSYTYDAEGKLKTKTRLSDGQVTEYFWDFRNRLSKVEERSAGGILLKTVEYKYDALNRRIAVIVNGTTTLLTTYDRDHAWADFTATGAVEKRYLFSEKIDEILAAWVSGQDFTWYHADKLGTIRDLSNLAGAIGQPIVYSAFGAIQSGLEGKEWNRVTFTGREWQPETGLYYYRARYYDPTSGRFISEDPIGFESGDINLRRFVANNPFNFTDPSGKAVTLEFVLTLAMMTSMGFVIWKTTKSPLATACTVIAPLALHAPALPWGALILIACFIVSVDWSKFHLDE